LFPEGTFRIVRLPGLFGYEGPVAVFGSHIGSHNRKGVPSMRSPASFRVIVGLLTIVCIGVPFTAHALVHELSEDFLTRQYCDLINTTAWWDTTGAGELKLWPFEMSLAGSSFAYATNVAVFGDYVYVTELEMEDGWLSVFDISDPSSPTPVGQVQLWNSHAVVISGNYAYVADDTRGLKVVDISDPTAPSVVGNYDTAGQAFGVDVSGDYVYLMKQDSLMVIDVSDPAAPSLAGGYVTPGLAVDVTVEGDYAYVADRAAGVTVVDISNPAAPGYAGNYVTADWAREIAISGNYAYVACRDAGLQVLNITDPTNPSLAGSYDTPGTAAGIVVSGDMAYLTDGEYGLMAIDISNPASPVLADSIGYGTMCDAKKVAVCGEYAYVTDYHGGFTPFGAIKAVHIADHVPPIPAGGCSTPGQGYDVAVSGNYAFMADDSYGLTVVDISDPGSPSHVVTTGSSGGPAWGVDVAGDYAFLATTAGLDVIDISDPTNPDTSAGFWHSPAVGAMFDVAVSGNYAYLTEWEFGDKRLYVVDITDPTSPFEVTNVSMPHYGERIAISGDYAYIACTYAGLFVCDISDPSSPESVAVYDTPGKAHGIAVWGDYVYLADGVTAGVLIFEVSDPTAPSLVGSYDTDNAASNVAISGDYAFVADVMDGLIVLDVSDPSHPTLVGSYDTPSAARGVAVSGEFAYVADGLGGFEVAQVFQSEFDHQRNTGQSLVVFQSDEEISGVKLTPTQVDSVYWYVSSDSGVTWTYVPTDGQWHGLSSPGGDLLWRTEHFYRTFEQNPACSDVHIEWRYSFAELDSVADVPEDEGGWVRVGFDASGLDAPEGDGTSGGRVTSYYTHRRIDDVGFVEEILEKGERVDETRPISVTGDEKAPMLPSFFGGARAYVLDGRYFYVSEQPVSGGFPPGTWEAVGSVPGTQEPSYYGLVPTKTDSGSVLEYTVYCISTHTEDPGVYFFSPPDSGYSVDNLPPGEPLSLSGDYTYPPAQLLITWDRNGERDFSHYAVYKGFSDDFEPEVGNRIGTPWDTFLVDSGFDPNVDNYYKVSAWDIHENESGYSLLGPDGMSGIGETPSVPEVTVLEQNVPNPFNPVTVIRFSIGEPGMVRLVVYDVLGRPVRRLFEGMRLRDRYEVVWDGRDDEGRPVASGVYLCELDAPGGKESKKMVLLK
jgi:hypothetical protein